MEVALRQQAERYLGTAIMPQEWSEAKAYAEHKLDCIIEREGDADGARREGWYLAQLIAESVRGSRFSLYLRELCGQREYIDQMGIKKEQPAH